MKALYALLTGALLIALTALGLTALASTDEEEGPPVFGFTNETCTSLNFKWFPNLGALIAYDGTEDSNDYTWDFGSYVEDVDTGYECTVLRYGEVTVTRKAPKKKQSSGGGSGGGSGSRTPQTPETTPPEQETEGEFEFDDQDLTTLNSCWQELAKTKLKSLKNEDKFETVTGYNWQTSTDSLPFFGATVHDPESGSPYVRIYTTSIQSHKPFGTLSKHVVRQAVLHEYIHTLQGQRAKVADSNWNDFAPYEWYDNEVQAWNLSRTWYYKLYSTMAPIAYLTQTEIDFSSTAEFLTNKQSYIDAKERIDNGTAEKGDKEKLEELEKWFKQTLPDFKGRGGGYDANAELEC